MRGIEQITLGNLIVLGVGNNYNIRYPTFAF